MKVGEHSITPNTHSVLPSGEWKVMEARQKTDRWELKTKITGQSKKKPVKPRKSSDLPTANKTKGSRTISFKCPGLASSCN